MKSLLFTLLLTLSTAAIVRLPRPDPLKTVLRLPSHLYQSRLVLSPTSRQGLTFDNCSTEVGCVPPRVCLLSGPPSPEEDDNGDDGDNGDDDDDGDQVVTDIRLALLQLVRQPAACEPDKLCQCAAVFTSPLCTSSDDCAEGESCAAPPVTGANSICFSDCALFVLSQQNPEFGFQVIDGPNPTACDRELVTLPPPTTSPGGTTSATTSATTTASTAATTTTTTTTTAAATTTSTTTVATTTASTTTAAPTTAAPTTAAPTTTAPVTTGGDPDDDDEVCFPASAIVHLANGEKLRMDELQAGHEVQHDTLGRSSKIFLFTHRTRDHQGWFYQLTTESGHSITLTGNHYIYADDRLTTADSVKRGDKLRTISGDSAVTRIRRAMGRGLYAPHSLHGDLVVDGIVVSGYSRAVHPSVAHALLTPVRWFVRKTGVVEPLGAMLYGGGRGVEKIMLKGADKY